MQQVEASKQEVSGAAEPKYSDRLAGQVKELMKANKKVQSSAGTDTNPFGPPLIFCIVAEAEIKSKKRKANDELDKMCESADAELAKGDDKDQLMGTLSKTLAGIFAPNGQFGALFAD